MDKPKSCGSGLGEGVAFAALSACAAWLEIEGKSAGGLWVLIVFWALLTSWGQKDRGNG